MPVRVRWLVIAAALALGGAALARPGKVIKVERRSARPPELAACIEHNPNNLVCFAGKIDRGDELHVLSESGEYKRVAISSIAPSRWDSCQLGALRDARTEVIEHLAGSGPPNPSRFHMELALKNVEPVPGRARLLPRDATPSPEPGAEIMFAVDLDGSGGAQLVLTNRECPEAQRLSPNLAGKQLRRSSCVTFWQRSPRSARWRAIRREVIHECR